MMWLHIVQSFNNAAASVGHSDASGGNSNQHRALHGRLACTPDGHIVECLSLTIARLMCRSLVQRSSTRAALQQAGC